MKIERKVKKIIGWTILAVIFVEHIGAYLMALRASWRDGLMTALALIFRIVWNNILGCGCYKGG